MADIEIPGYDVLIPNSTWGRNARPVINCSSTTQILQLAKYTVPIQDDIIRFIQYIAEQYTSQNRGNNGEIQLQNFLQKLPFIEVLKIAKGLGGAINFLQRHFPEREPQEGRTYLQFINGILTNKVLREYRATLEKKGAFAYSYLLDIEGFQNSNIEIRLNGRNTLPRESQIETLLQKGDIDNDVLKVEGLQNPEDIRESMQTLYFVLDSREKIQRVDDNSQNILELRAALILGKTLKSFRTRRQRTPYDLENPFSDN